jgi:hypothetical protein
MNGRGEILSTSAARLLLVITTFHILIKHLKYPFETLVAKLYSTYPHPAPSREMCVDGF